MKFFLIPGGKTVTLHPALREAEAGRQQKMPLGDFLTAFIETMRFEGEECVDALWSKLIFLRTVGNVELGVQYAKL